MFSRATIGIAISVLLVSHAASAESATRNVVPHSALDALRVFDDYTASLAHDDPDSISAATRALLRLDDHISRETAQQLYFKWDAFSAQVATRLNELDYKELQRIAAGDLLERNGLHPVHGEEGIAGVRRNAKYALATFGPILSLAEREYLKLPAETTWYAEGYFVGNIDRMGDELVALDRYIANFPSGVRTDEVQNRARGYLTTLLGLAVISESSLEIPWTTFSRRLCRVYRRVMARSRRSGPIVRAFFANQSDRAVSEVSVQSFLVQNGLIQ